MNGAFDKARRADGAAFDGAAFDGGAAGGSEGGVRRTDEVARDVRKANGTSEAKRDGVRAAPGCGSPDGHAAAAIPPGPDAAGDRVLAPDILVPQIGGTGDGGDGPEGAEASPSRCEGLARLRPRDIAVMKVRRDFLACAGRGARWTTPGLVVQGRARGAGEPAAAPVRVGYTCTKKVGNAVARNRAKRRMRAAAAEVLPQAASPGWDYVLVGLHAATAARPFARLLSDLREALGRLHAGRAQTGGPPRRKPRKGPGRGRNAGG